ncbi:MAG TPA: cupin domain-containing protein [Gemmatimonadaceae bacterium]|nr:cupin domain-containing protein [Gemmatimonadaceae bacterium]
MKRFDPLTAARQAVANRPDRPATAIVHDSPDVRLIVFRIAPGQSVAPHQSTSSVQITVLDGVGVLTGESGNGGMAEQVCSTGDVAVYLPNELHGMRAAGETDLLLLATITPRPGGGH